MTSKPWYKRRRYWSLAILVALVYFCLIPSPLRVSPQTTGFTEPLLPNGDVDYFGAYERMYIHKLSPPEDNGQRLLIAALGPRVLEQAALMDAVPWEQLPTHEMSKRWFEEYWVPLCEHMFIDPYVKPRFLDSLDYYSFMKKEWKANNQDENARYDHKENEELRQKLIAAPWTAEEQPIVARWLEERSPVLDLFGVAVRKPNFVSWRQRPESGHFYSVLIPDIQWSRNFGRELPVRVTERLGRGDVDGAWYDVMTLFYLSRKHYSYDPLNVTYLIGSATELAGWRSAQVVLQHGNLSPEQLERFAQDLDSLPRNMVLFSELELYGAYSGLQLLQNDKDTFEELVGRPRKPITDLATFFIYLMDASDNYTNNFIPRYITLLPFDRNIAGRRISEFLQTEWQQSGNSAWRTNPAVAIEHFENMESRSFERGWQLDSHWSLLRVPLIRTRSELIADYVMIRFYPAFRHIQESLNRINTQFDLLRLSIALERYRAANGEYPETLDALVPTYLIEVPLEPLTGRQSFAYQREPDEQTAFLLRSAEWREDDGRTKELFVRMAPK